MRRVPHVVAAVALALAGCGDDGGAKRIEHRAVYATDLGVFDLSIARLSKGGTMLFWTEGSMGQGEPTWMKFGDVQAHRISLPPTESYGDRSFARLLALEGGDGRFVTYAMEGFLTVPTLHEIVIDPEGALISYRNELPSFRNWLSRPIDVFPFSNGRVGLIGYEFNFEHFTAFNYVATSAEPGQALGDPHTLAELESLCAPQMLGTSTPRGFGIIVETVCLQGDDEAFHWETVAKVITAAGERVDEVGEEGPVDPPGDLLAVGSNQAGVALLVGRADGALVLDAIAFGDDASGSALVEGLFDSVAWQLDGASREPRLFATDTRFVVVWNEAQADGQARRTRAVVVTPGEGAGDAFDWPVSDEECPVRSAIAEGERLEYTCAARCLGVGCAEHWVYHGEVELP